MEREQIFRDIAERTGGDIYLGFVGPVRTGKSTFIKKFMEIMVLPNIQNPKEKDRARDELPQSGAGKQIMTSEPKFVPQEAVEIVIKEGLKMKVRLVDCVGYTVEGAIGYEGEDGPRMVRTPWFEHEVPFQEAAELGTRKVIEEHATLGIIVITDGSITNIPRESYIDAEERVIWELKEVNKPFIVVLNSTRPYEQETTELARELEEKYHVPVLPLNCAGLTQDDILMILEEALYEFPVAEVNINLPRWVDQLQQDHWLKSKFEEAVQEAVNKVERLRDIDEALEIISTNDFVGGVHLKNMDLGTGAAYVEMGAREGLFYQVLEELSGHKIEGDHTILRLLSELSGVKKQYDKVAAGLQQVMTNGYGIVLPTMEEMDLMEPEIIKQGGRSGVKLKAKAASYHMIRADITTEITPLIGTEKQCEELIEYIMDEFEEDPQRIWDTNIFGKSLHELVKEGVQSKLLRMPEDAQMKLQQTLTRIVNDGGGGLICIII